MTAPELPPLGQTTLSEKERATLYVEMWKQTVTVQQHFNDIEWRIRGLALTATTFSVGAAGLAVNNNHPFPAVAILVVGLILWYAFYFVDRYWYHPLLIASVKQGHQVEGKIEQSGLPDSALTKMISAGSPIGRPRLIRFFTWNGKRDEKLRSEGKLVWFYGIGAIALVAAILGCLGAAAYGAFRDSPKPEPTVVKLEAPPTVTATVTVAPRSSTGPPVATPTAPVSPPSLTFSRTA